VSKSAPSPLEERHPCLIVSVFRLLKRLVVPAPDEDWSRARMGVRADLAWQPYLFLAVFYGTILSVTLGDKTIDPPGADFEAAEWLWSITAIGSPPLAFVAVWMIIHTSGRWRYLALWLRLAADIGIMAAMIAYLYEHIATRAEHPFEGAIVVASIIFIWVLIWRDIRFLIITERLARKLLQSAGEP
jgi:hypothetical protein